MGGWGEAPQGASGGEGRGGVEEDRGDEKRRRREEGRQTGIEIKGSTSPFYMLD